MALSNREQQLLSEIEQELTVDDPRLATRLSLHDTHARLVHLVLTGLLTLGCSVILMVISLTTGSPILGDAAFILSILGVYIATIPLSGGGVGRGKWRVHNDSPPESSQ